MVTIARASQVPPQSALSSSSAPSTTSTTPRQLTPDIPTVAAAPPAPSVVPTKMSASLGPLAFIGQTLNNCGPASVSEVLSYWSIVRSQRQVQSALRADGNTHGMSLFGVPSYARSVGVDTLMGVAGNDALIKALISNGFPVIVSQWVSLSDQYGHYRPIQAYDDQRGGFVASDPYLGPNAFMSYTEFDQTWDVTDKRFIVIYPPGRGTC